MWEICRRGLSWVRDGGGVWRGDIEKRFMGIGVGGIVGSECRG